jgi:hypothetical protein
MNTIRLLSPIVQDTIARGRTRYRSKVVVDYPPLSFVNATGIGVTGLPSPNLQVAELVVDDATLAAIQADVNYAGGVLWIDTQAPPDQPPATEEFNNLQAALAAQTQGKLTAAPALDPGNTRAQNEAIITAWTQQLQAAVMPVSPPPPAPPPPPPPPIGTGAALSGPSTLPGTAS